jgi:hypothetical protein
MTHERFGRRMVLRGAGGVVVGLPLLGALGGAGRARAARRTPQRFVVVFSGNGTIHYNWRPAETGTGFTFAHATPPPAAPPKGHHGPMPGDPHILAPLEPFKRKLIVLDNLDVPSRRHGPGANGHDKGMGHMLTGALLRVGPSGIGDFSHLPDGTAGGPSIDQAIARRIGGGTRFSSIELGVMARLDTKRQLTSRMCYRGPFEVVPPESDPAEAFKALFSGAAEGSDEIARLRRTRQSVLDSVREDFRRLERRLGGDDRRRLDAHATAIRELENALQPPAAERASCRRASPNPGSQTIDAWEPSAYPQVGKLQMDLITTALACDFTRVASLQWSTGQSGVRFSWLDQNEGHHGLSHLADDSADVRSKITRIDHWYAQQFAYLLGRLDEIPEGDGTLLDRSVVLWVNEQGNGDKHSEIDVPHILAGSGGGRLRTGRYLKCGHRAVNDLFVSLLQAFGAEEATSFGYEPVCRGPLEDLS